MLSIALNESLKMTNLESALFFTYLKDFKIANDSAENTLECRLQRLGVPPIPQPVRVPRGLVILPTYQPASPFRLSRNRDSIPSRKLAKQPLPHFKVE